MPLRVLRVDAELIYCVPLASRLEGATPRTLVWTFDRKTGAEVDRGLCWGPQYGRTGSQLVKSQGG
jgi:hypothetical protein